MNYCPFTLSGDCNENDCALWLFDTCSFVVIAAAMHVMGSEAVKSYLADCAGNEEGQEPPAETAAPAPVSYTTRQRRAAVDDWAGQFVAAHFIGRYTVDVFEEYQNDVIEGKTPDCGATQQLVTYRVMHCHGLRVERAAGKAASISKFVRAD